MVRVGLFSSRRSVTLIELIIVVVIVAVMALAISSLTLLSHRQLISASRRAKVQNEVAYCLEHITKHVLNTIGNTAISATNPVYIVPNTYLAVFIDANGDGMISASGDHWIRYTFNSSLGQLVYCSRSETSISACIGVQETISSKIIRRRTGFIPATNFTEGRNYLIVSITGCYDPDGSPSACGTSDNPQINMVATMQLPGVSSH